MHIVPLEDTQTPNLLVSYNQYYNVKDARTSEVGVTLTPLWGP